VDVHAQRAPPLFDLAVEFGLEIDDRPGDIVHALRHLSSLPDPLKFR
jgi:hypothetical protein